MKYIKITSARSHQEKNPKTSLYKQLEKYALSLDNNKYFISFTKVNKVGINPNFKYLNPIGVYSYSLLDVYTDSIKSTDFGVFSKYPYLQILKTNTIDTRILSDIISNARCKNDLKLLKRYFDENKESIDIFDCSLNSERIFEIPVFPSLEYLYKEVDALNIAPDDVELEVCKRLDFDYILRHMVTSLCHNDYPSNSPILLVWLYTCCMAYLFAPSSKKSVSVKWNYILSKVLGYEQVRDYGLGFIRSLDRKQNIFLSNKAYTLVETISNTREIIKEPFNFNYISSEYPVDDEQSSFFLRRHQQHVRDVQENVKKLITVFPKLKSLLLKASKNHDESKLHDPEKFGYTWRYSYIYLNRRMPEEVKKYVENYIVYNHKATNRHHPEFWQFRGGIRQMPLVELAHMVCDWAAVSKELHTDLLHWWRTVQRQYDFSDKQKKAIEQFVKCLS